MPFFVIWMSRFGGPLKEGFASCRRRLAGRVAAVSDYGGDRPVLDALAVVLLVREPVTQEHRVSRSVSRVPQPVMLRQIG